MLIEQLSRCKSISGEVNCWKMVGGNQLVTSEKLLRHLTNEMAHIGTVRLPG